MSKHKLDVTIIACPKQFEVMSLSALLKLLPAETSQHVK